MNKTERGGDTKLDHNMENNWNQNRDLDWDSDPDLHRRKQFTGGMVRNNDNLSKCLSKVISPE